MPLIKTCEDRFPELIMALLARFSVVASQTWEATPMKIKCLPLNSLKKEHKLFLLDSKAS